MHQFELVHDDIFSALRGLVSACGGSKVIGPQIWPGKGEKSAAWLDDCLNIDRAAKLDPQELILLLKLGRDRGFHSAKHFLDDETHYERSAPIDPEDQRAKLQREYIEAVSRLEQLTRALNTTLKAVR